MIDYPTLYQRATVMAPVFANAKPFPHVILDNLFDQHTYEMAKAAFPSVNSSIWKKPENAHTKGKFVTKRGPEGIKELLYTDLARNLLRELNSASFLHFLGLLAPFLILYLILIWPKLDFIAAGMAAILIYTPIFLTMTLWAWKEGLT